MTTPLFAKLNLKDQKSLVILNAPQEFESEVARLEGVEVIRDAGLVAGFDFFMAFVTRQEEVEKLLPMIEKKAKGDAVLWLVYPKGTSRKYRCDFNRDTIWGLFEPYGFSPVRMVPIDADWSGFRFRRKEYVKSK